MHPVLLEIGQLKIHTYGFMIALGFLLAMYFGSRAFRKIDLNPEKFVDLAFWSLVAGIGGARVLYIITRWDSFASNPMTMFYIWEGGLVFFGGLIAAGIFDYIFMRKHKLPLWKTLDILSMAVVIGHAFGRIGCFFAGCCHGKPTESKLGVKFYSDLVEPSLQGIPLHPTQLYESFSLFIILGVLYIVDKKKKFDGQVFVVYLVLYSIVRSIIEIFRGDKIRGFVVEDVLSTSQFISILVVTAGVLFLFVRLKTLKNKNA